jgi:hypothetical protein
MTTHLNARSHERTAARSSAPTNVRLTTLAAALMLSGFLSACSDGNTVAEPPAAVTNNPPSVNAPTAREALPALSQDTNPSGARDDQRDKRFFAFNDGDVWTYARSGGGAQGLSMVTQTSTATGPTSWSVKQSDATGKTLNVKNLNATNEGVMWLNPIPDAPAGAQAVVGSVLLFPEPFYAVGSTRTSVRQGNWGQDSDADGINESFRFELKQTFLGYEPFDGLVKPVDAAHFRTVTTLLVAPSKLPSNPRTVTVTEDSWWAPGVGLVRQTRYTTTSDGVGAEPEVQLVLGGAQLATGPLLTTTSTTVGVDGGISKIQIPHNALVYSAVHRRYYASVPAIDATRGNRIAAIDPDTGVVTLSDVVGDGLGALALSGNGSYLFVGVDGTGELVKLSLPSLTLQSRTALPLDANGALQRAESIAVSPSNETVAAVSLERPGQSPRHGGVALVYTGALLPKVTAAGVGGNLVTFSEDGSRLYGFNTETAAGGLSMMDGSFDGVSVNSVLALTQSPMPRRMVTTAQGVWLSGVLYNTDGFAAIGSASTRSGACGLNGAALVCLDNAERRVTTSNAATFAEGGKATYATTAVPVFDMVPGPRGQAALRGGMVGRDGASEVWLFSSNALR